MKLHLIPLAVLLLPCLSFASDSIIKGRPDDSEAVYVLRDVTHARGDGQTDDSAAIQQAIDTVHDQHNEGIVFIPEGRYRLTRTIFLWPGVRLIGYGASRPTFVLGQRTPGYQDGIAYMFFFAGARPAAPVRGEITQQMRYRRPPTPPGTVPLITTVPDATPDSFYSAISNVDFDIGEDNAGAVAVRFHAAQHAYLSHIEFHIGSGFAGVHEVANEAEDLHFYGGQYGIMARKPSPAWQFTLIDSTFEGQRVAAIRENEAGLTLVNNTFRNVPAAVEIDPHYSDQLWIKNARFEHISGPAVLISNQDSRMTEVNIEDAVCLDVPVFARLRESGKEFRGVGKTYRVSTFSHGLTFSSPNSTPEIRSGFRTMPLSAVPSELSAALPPLPTFATWVNVKTLGVEGDGKTDDTIALQHAIDSHATLYFPQGRYLVHDTITLRPDSVLMGFHPSRTQIDLPDGTPAFQSPGAPKALVLAPPGGNAILSGIGIFTGGLNGRATGLVWRSGEKSLVNDVRFLGGHGTNAPNGARTSPYNSNHSADPDLHRPWDAQYPSLWVDGGGGSFANIWTPDTYSQAGMRISNTSIPGFVYEVSSEHHVRSEFQLSHVSNWKLYALQTEGESGESQFASSLEIDHSSNLTIANYHGYRVTHMEQPFPYAVRITQSNDIRFRNVHVDGNSSIGLCVASGECRQAVRPNKVPFENAIVDETLHVNVRDREFAFLDISDDHPLAPATPASSHVEQLATGFFNISCAAVNSKGELYFVDAHSHTIYRWNATTRKAEIVRDAPTGPVNLIFDKSDDLIVLSSGGTNLSAYVIRPEQFDGVDARLDVLQLKPLTDHPGGTVAMPVDYWFNGDFSNTLSPTQPYTYISLEDMFRRGLGSPKTHEFVAPDGSLFIPTNLPIVQGEPFWGTKWGSVLDAYGLAKASPGKPFFATNESEQRTYRGILRSDGSLADIKVFTERGGESLAADPAGNLYMAAGQLYVYSPQGMLLRTVAIPERPHDILFGGKNLATLYLLSSHSLFAVQLSAHAQSRK